MNTRKQVIVSAAIVAAAAGAVRVYAAVGRGSDAAEAASAHAAHGAGPAGGAERPVRLTAEGARRIGVTYATAERRALVSEVRAVGNVSYDETSLANVNPKVEGWVERLYVEFTGAPVRRGQPLMEVYSPMLVSAQEELILAQRLVDEASAGGSEQAARSARDLLVSARRRLRYWDVPEAEVARLERTLTPRRTVTLVAPATGVVVEKNVVQGTRIMPGMDLFRIAGLARVWIEVDVFERDLSLVRPGQHAVITFDAYPGEEFEGRVTYVYPSVAVSARTARVRLELANPGGRLRPGMFANVRLHLPSPREAVVIPRAAVHSTGRRSLVFVRQVDGSLVHREVVTGMVSGDYVEVVSGLGVGEVVVSSANFLVDAESSMGSSMESMPGMDSPAAPTPAPDTAGGHAGHRM